MKRLQAAANAQNVSRPLFSWSTEDILAARAQQMIGNFSRPARLAESMRTDDAIFIARTSRLAPSRVIKSALKTPYGGSAFAKEAAALFGSAGVAIHPDTVADIHGTLVDHGVAFGFNRWETLDDGSRVVVKISSWPIDSVRWDAYRGVFLARFEDGTEEEIIHGDGRWTIFRMNENDPFKNGAIVPGALLWGRHAFALLDWSKSSTAHGNAKIMGSLAEGTPLQKDGGLSPEAAAMVAMMQGLLTDFPVALLPPGAKADFIANGSNAWQVFAELISNAEKAAARIYLGTDGILGSQGGAPGVDVGQLLGVAATRVEGDLKCLARGFSEGVIAPYFAVNFGSSERAPAYYYQLPDADQEAILAALERRTNAFHSEIKSLRENGFEVTQDLVNAAAARHGVAAPLLPVQSAKGPSIALAPTDIARVVTVNEARASAGVGPLLKPDGSADQDGKLTVEQFAGKKAAEAAASNPPATTPPAA